MREPLQNAVLGLTLAFGVAGACFSPLDDSPFLVSEGRILAVRAEPAEALPGEEVQYSYLIAGAVGDDLSPTFSYCLRSPRSESAGSLSQECAAGDSLLPVLQSAAIPQDTCFRFGPNTPPTSEGEGERRPSDPDASGGYYQPLVVELDGEVTVFNHRVRCDLTGVRRELFEEFQRLYLRNENPVLASENQSMQIVAGESLAWEVSASVTSFQNYPRVLVEQGVLEERQEKLAVTFYVSAGSLSVVEQTLDLDNPVARTQWRIPEGHTNARGWAVVVDERGGVTWQTLQVEVLAP